MRKYQRNHIYFRIASADAIGKFKCDQAHSFLQITRKELSFDIPTKEAVLLSYDILSQYIFRIEKTFLAAGEGSIPLNLRPFIIQSFIDEFKTIEAVMEAHSNTFTREVIQYMRVIHSYSRDIMFSKFTSCMSLNVSTAYSRIVFLISKYLQHLLIALHEFNNNLITRDQAPFICASEFSSDADNAKFEHILKRLNFFTQAGCGTAFTFKNYSGKDSLFPHAFDWFVAHGIVLNKEVLHADTLKMTAAQP